MLQYALLTVGLALALVPSSLHAQFPLNPPAVSDMRLGLSGSPATGFGITGYRNASLGQPNTGHLVSGVVLNAPDPYPQPEYKLYADYYITGIDNSPFSKPNGGVAAAQATTPFNLTHLPSYLSNNGLAYGDIHFRFGQKVAADIQTSWNLGGDDQGDDWTGSLASSVEERIYTANPADAEASLWFDGVKIITFGYSSLYEVIDYGPTTGTGDDTIRAYSDAVVPDLVTGLAGHSLGVAEAFLADVLAGGGLVRLDFDTIQPATYPDSFEMYQGVPYLHFNYQFTGSISIIPEPAHYGLILAIGSLGVVASRRRRVG